MRKRDTPHSRPQRGTPPKSGGRSSAALIIFAKAAVPGQVKTRLCPPLTPDEAATLHGTFVLDVLERSAAAAKQVTPRNLPPFDRILACSPSAEHVFFKVLEDRHGVRLIDQTGEDIGARMGRAMSVLLQEGYQRVVLVGTDVPMLPPSVYLDAFAALAHHDVVLGPALDGGYYLIGLTRVQPELFGDISWSTPNVLAETEQRARGLGLTTTRLQPSLDIDTIDDLKTLIRDCGLEGPAGKDGQSGASALSTRTAGAVRVLGSRIARRAQG